MSNRDSAQALYGLLGISAESSYVEVKRSFRFAIRANHPDRNPNDPFAERRFKEINAAWDLVNTAEKWEAHQACAQATAPQRDAAPQRESQPPPTVAVRAPTLLVERLNVPRDGVARWKVMLDGEPVAKLGLGQSVRIATQHGSHQLYIATAFVNRSLPVTVELAEGQEAVFRCSLYSYWKAYTAPKRAVKLERVN